MRRALLVSLVACAGSASYKTAPRESMMVAGAPSPAEYPNTESYQDYGKNPWIETSRDHLSTFAADVDTASYTIARRKLQEGTLPPAASVRVEEWVNYFHYAFPGGGAPFAVVMDAALSANESGSVSCVSQYCHSTRLRLLTDADRNAEFGT